MRHMNQPPISHRKNAPLRENMAQMPHWFSQDQQYEVKDYEAPSKEPKKTKKGVGEYPRQQNDTKGLVPMVGSKQ